MSFNWMEKSPAGRPIEVIPGVSSTIRRRGNEITALGNKMIDSADFLESLAEETTDQRGKAIEKLREIVGDTYAELRRAGNLYRPTGPVLVAYATALDDVQPKVRSAVNRCVETWVEYDSAPGYRDGGRPTWGAPDAGTPEAEAAADADSSKEQKYDAFITEARGFDSVVDTWEHAFDTAANGITEVLDGKIEDSFWDNVDGYVAAALEVLQVIGIIVGIAAIIIGGPIFAVIGTIVGLITLGLTIYQAIRGDAGLDKVIFAVIGIIPFGSAGKLFQQGKRLEFLGDFVSASNFSKFGGEVTSIRSLFANGDGLFSGAWNVIKGKNPAGIGDVFTRFMFGKDTTKLTDIVETMVGGPGKGAAAWEFAYMMVSGPWKSIDNIAKWTGNSDASPSSQLPLVGALL